MNTIERALMHALFTHLHHNIDQAVDFRALEELNRKVSQKWPQALTIGPGDDAAVFQMPGIKGISWRNKKAIVLPVCRGLMMLLQLELAVPCEISLPWEAGLFSS